MPKLWIKTYGCQMNVYDSSRMADLLAPLGFSTTAVPDDADLAILNTCHIREKAEDKLFSDLGRLRPLQQARRLGGDRMLIAVAGCVAQAEGDDILRRAPHVDMVFGPQTYHRLPEFIERARRKEQGEPTRPIVDTDFPAEVKFDLLPAPSGARSVSAFLSIQEGCDKFCTFCVVPFTRGAEYSRPVTSIVEEAERLVAGGVRELTLLGQNVNAYRGPAPAGGVEGLAGLARRLASIPGLLRIRYTTSHPRDVDPTLVEAHRSLPQLMPFLHLPVQSGSDAVLARMNRRHTADDYLRTVDRLRAARPDMAFSSDFIVGFPGETDRDFSQTLELVERIGYAQAFSFRYSPRPGTGAVALDGRVPDDVADARLQQLQAVLERQQRAFNAAMIGRSIPVLFDRPGRHAGQLVGRSPYLQGVHCTSDARFLGSVQEVRITDSSLNSLGGVLCRSDADRLEPAA